MYPSPKYKRFLCLQFLFIYDPSYFPLPNMAAVVMMMMITVMGRSIYTHWNIEILYIQSYTILKNGCPHKGNRFIIFLSSQKFPMSLPSQSSHQKQKLFEFFQIRLLLYIPGLHIVELCIMCSFVYGFFL